MGPRAKSSRTSSSLAWTISAPRTRERRDDRRQPDARSYRDDQRQGADEEAHKGAQEAHAADMAKWSPLKTDGTELRRFSRPAFLPFKEGSAPAGFVAGPEHEIGRPTEARAARKADARNAPCNLCGSHGLRSPHVPAVSCQHRRRSNAIRSPPPTRRSAARHAARRRRRRRQKVRQRWAQGGK